MPQQNPQTETDTGDHPILLFDGVCKFCHSSVQFVIKRDTNREFFFCPIQSSRGQQLMKHYGVEESGLNTMLLLDNNRVYNKSTAALRIARKLTMPWPLLSMFLVIPPPIRNAVYDFIGKRRYQWFGKYDQCHIPDDTTRQRFIE
ncbi:MAG: DCC1-like thiol-disulfide oxidoreductase family protein [Gammaproteobacteria bacterium]|jgi:predicted DCC family thiol-disulfide oxidoreductase YuxK